MSHLRESAIRIKSQDGGNPERLKGLDYARGALYHLLRNRIYVGEIEHKGSIYPGEHKGIIDREIWDQVQKLLDDNRQGTRGRPRKASGSLLTGLLFSESGVRYIPTNTQKGGRRYHYYTSQAIIKGNREDDSVGRLPAPVIEAAVATRILKFLESPIEVLDALKRLEMPITDHERALKIARQRALEWPRLPESEKANLIRTVLHRVVVHEGSIDLELNAGSAVAALLGKRVLPEIGSRYVQTFRLKTSFRHVAQGKALKLVIGNGLSQSSASREAIAKAIARARSWYELIVQGKVAGLTDICRQHRLTHRYVKNIFPLAFLGPEFVGFLLNNCDGELRTLDSLIGKVPMRWDEQREFVRGA